MGRLLGGSTSHNAMLYFRGFKNDFDFWAANGAKGWSYRDVIPYFLKFENFEFPNANPNDNCGELTVTQNPEIEETPMYKVFDKATKQMNMPVVPCNVPNPDGK
ncbi:hypothetical protein KUTeg_011018 [Tegillarca granosa]|uniref:Glucose-methanol-choline oxidoreductase N-terminal domain-containing protein n=1 Tax=Tegillarca granosa TaxID=220873 RepID=A0ABQ9F2N9_TEGGR|nr:hypothetical protein KUTeg_011018 [Tegillarca granosa]